MLCVGAARPERGERFWVLVRRRTADGDAAERQVGREFIVSSTFSVPDVDFCSGGRTDTERVA